MLSTVLMGLLKKGEEFKVLYYLIISDRHLYTIVKLVIEEAVAFQFHKTYDLRK